MGWSEDYKKALTAALEQLKLRILAGEFGDFEEVANALGQLIDQIR